MAFIFLRMEKQSARNLVRAQLHLVMTNPPRLHTIPGKLNTVSGNKDTEMEDFPMGSTCGKILTYIRGAKSCLVWNDAANTPLTSFFSAGACLRGKDHTDSGGLPPTENFGQNCFIS